MHGYCCPCIVFSSVLPSRNLRCDRTPDRKYSPGRRRMAVRRLAGPNESSACRPVFPALRSGTQATSGNGLTGFRNPQNPMDAHLRVNRKNPLSPHSVSFRPSRLPTSGTLRNRTSPRLSPQHASPPWGRPRSARFFTCGNTSPNETQRRDTSRNEKSPRPKPLRTASYRLGGRPPQNDVAPRPGPPPTGGKAGDDRPPPRRIRPQGERRTLRDARPGQEAYGGEMSSSSAARVPSKGDSISRHTERTYLPLRPMSFAAAACGPGRAAAESGSSPETQPAVAHPGIRIRKMQSDTSIHRSIYFPSSPATAWSLRIR